jgi:hypothetical protein
MDHLIDSFHISDVLTQTTDILTTIAPVLELLVGLLLAFFVIKYLITAISGKKVADDDDFDYYNDDY